MKSIVEEASSIAKAIENGWIRAGKPQEFTVRIFEESEKNFLGFSKKPAKVGFFYYEAPVQQQSRGKDLCRQQSRQQTTPRVSTERIQQPQKPIAEQRPNKPTKIQQPIEKSPTKNQKMQCIFPAR